MQSGLTVAVKDAEGTRDRLITKALEYLGSMGITESMAMQIVIGFDKSLLQHFDNITARNEFVANLVERSLTPVAWSLVGKPSPIGFMLEFRSLRRVHCRLDNIDLTFCDLC
jgi:hypothetical protein